MLLKKEFEDNLECYRDKHGIIISSSPCYIFSRIKHIG
jgi:hypothetical protein